jgi:hypothetical protein
MAILAFPSSAILDSTAAGRSILTAADAPAQRSLLGLGTSDSPAFVAQTLSGQSLTGSQATSLLDLATTWNTTGTPTAIQLNVTDTASNAASQLVNLRVGGTSLFNIDKAGVVTVAQRIAFDGGAGTSPRLRRLGSNLDCVNNSETAFLPFRAGEFWLGSSLALVLDASDILAQRRGAVAQAFRLYNTFTDTSNYERGKFAWESNVLRIGTERAGTGLARNLELQTGGSARLTIDGNGSASFSGHITATTGFVQLSNVILSSVSSIVSFTGDLFQPVSLRVFNITDGLGLNAEYGQFAWNSNVLRIGTVKTGTGVARALEFQTDGVTRMTFTGAGQVTVNAALAVQGSGISAIGQVTVAGAATQFVFDAASGSAYAGSSGATSLFGGRSGFAPTSGTMTFTGFLFNSTINQTGGANGVTRGIFINPTLTAAADWRAIEVASGITILGPSTTAKASLNIPSGSDPTSPAQGDLWVNSSGDLRYRNASSTITLGSGGGGSQNVFSTIAVSGQSNVEADTTTDTLTLAAGSGISIATNATTDTITISATGGGGGGGLSRYTAIALGW